MLDFLKGTTRTGLWCMALVSAGAVLFGFDNGWWGTIQGAEAFLRDFGTCETVDGVEICDITTAQRAAGSSVQSGGIMVGSVVSLYANQRWGRRAALMLAAAISITGVLIELTSAVGSARFAQFVAGKAVASVSMGMAASIVPIYLSETSTSAARGFTINVYQNVLIVGYLVAIAVVYASAQRTDSAAYYIPLALQLVAPLLMLTLMPLLPESPRWLVWNRRIDDAIASSQRLFGTSTNDFDAEDYVRQIEIAMEQDRSNPNSTRWSDLFHGPDLRRLLIAVGVQCLIQAQGSSYITNYSVSFLGDAGVTDVFPYIMGINLVYYLGILTGHFLPDRYGRRPVLIWSSAWCGAFMVIVATVMTAAPSTKASSAAGLSFVFIWQLASGVMSPLVWIVCTEAAPTRNREKVLSVAIFISFGVALLITSCSPYIQDSGYGNVGIRIGYIWGGFSLVTAVWSFFMVPETMGLSLEQLDYLYEQRVPTRDFKKYKFSRSVLAGEEDKIRDIGDA